MEYKMQFISCDRVPNECAGSCLWKVENTWTLLSKSRGRWSLFITAFSVRWSTKKIRLSRFSALERPTDWTRVWSRHYLISAVFPLQCEPVVLIRLAVDVRSRKDGQRWVRCHWWSALRLASVKLIQVVADVELERSSWNTERRIVDS